MRRTTRCLLFTLALAMPKPASAGDPPVDLGKVTEKHEMVPMRDGKKLSVYLYFPEGKGPWPAIFQQRYLNVRSAATRKDYARLAANGYVVAVENFRGTHLSEGTWVGYRSLGWGELKDGYDTVEWLAKQPWCTGKIGTMGGSQSGFAQNFLAVTRPPHLVCQYMIDTGLSLYHEGYRFGGTIRLGRLKSMEKMCRDPEDNRRLVREWFEHPTYDSYWADEDCTRHFAKMNVPCFTVGGYFDLMSVGSIESYLGRQHRGDVGSRGQQQLILGPWPHGRPKEINKVGEMVFPENARFAIDAHIVGAGSTIDVGWISQVFNRGHRIRIAITSSGAPYFEPNPNTGEKLTYITPQRMEVATNSVHHDRQYSSCILAPVR